MTEDFRNLIGHLEEIRTSARHASCLLRNLKELVSESAKKRIEELENETVILIDKNRSLEAQLEEKTMTIARLGMEYGNILQKGEL